MPAAPVIMFPGVEAVRSAIISRTHGVSPNAIILNIAPQNTLIHRIGPLTVSYEGTILVIPDCIVDQSTFQFDVGRRIISLVLFDRRWKWSYGMIGGHYNRENQAGELISPERTKDANTVLDSVRSNRDLARLLLDAMGEVDYDVADMPNGSLIEREWDCDNPALALADLCEDTACTVVLRWNNTVKIVNLGVGSRLPVAALVNSNPVPAFPGLYFPVTMPITSVVQSVDPAERPDSITVCTSPILFQMDMELEAVGEDLDGAIKPLKALSFAPNKNADDGGFADYFGGSELGFIFDDDKKSKITNHSVYKLYRVKVPFTFPARAPAEPKKKGKSTGPNPPITVSHLEEIRPLLRYQIGTVLEDGIRTHKSAIVYGIWYNEDIFGNTTSVARPAIDPSTEDGARLVADLDEIIVPGGFAIDANRCLVAFGNFIYREWDGNDEFNGTLFPAKLFLRCAFNYRLSNGSWQRFFATKEQPPPKLGTETLVLKRPQLLPVAKVTYQDVGSGDPDVPKRDFAFWQVETNYDYIQEHAEDEITAAQDAYVTDIPLQITYAGFFPIDPDGAIRSIEYSLDSDGADGITTTVYRNQDTGARGNPNWAQTRINQRLRYMMDALSPMLTRQQMREQLRRNTPKGER